MRKLTIRQRLTPAKTGKFKAYQNDAGEWCIGNNCMRMTAGKEAVRIAFNPDGRNCPKNLDSALDALREVVADDKPANFAFPKKTREKW